jgi:hypothetical protein
LRVAIEEESTTVMGNARGKTFAIFHQSFSNFHFLR